MNDHRVVVLPDSNLAGAILTTICCCLPFGIVSIVYAAQVDSKGQSGDYDGARRAASKSRFWMWWGIGIGLIANFILMLLFVAAESPPY